LLAATSSLPASTPAGALAWELDEVLRAALPDALPVEAELPVPAVLLVADAPLAPVVPRAACAPPELAVRQERNGFPDAPWERGAPQAWLQELDALQAVLRSWEPNASPALPLEQNGSSAPLAWPPQDVRQSSHRSAHVPLQAGLDGRLPDALLPPLAVPLPEQTAAQAMAWLPQLQAVVPPPWPDARH
jgi:hypothetical protein